MQYKVIHIEPKNLNEHEKSFSCTLELTLNGLVKDGYVKIDHEIYFTSNNTCAGAIITAVKP